MKRIVSLLLSTTLVLGAVFSLSGNALYIQAHAAGADEAGQYEPEDEEHTEPEENGSPEEEEELPADENEEDGGKGGSPEETQDGGEEESGPGPEDGSGKDDDDPEDSGDAQEQGALILGVDLLRSGVESKVILSAVDIKLGGSDIEGQEGVDPYATITVGFTFSVPSTEGVFAGDSVTLTLPDELLVDTGDDDPYVVDIPLVGTDIVIATVTLTEGSQDMVLTFTDRIEEYDNISYAYFGITCRFNGDELGEGGERTILFQYEGETFGVKVNFKEPDTGLGKELDSQSTDPDTGAPTQVWKITANSAENTLRDPVFREDLSDGLQYVGFQFAGYAMNQEPAGWSVTDNSASTGEVLFSYDGEWSDEVEFYVHTRITDFSQFETDPADGDYVVVENTVYFRSGSREEVSVSDSAQIYAGHLKKSGEFDEVNLVIRWELILNEQGGTMDELVLWDTIPAGLELLEGSIEFRTQSGPLDVGTGAGSDVVLTKTDEGDGSTTYRFAFARALKERCVVTYTTKLTGEGAANGFEFTNRAYLEWAGGMTSCIGTGEVKGTTGMLQKNGTGYNGSNQEIRWTITVNQNFYPITEAVEILDDYMPSNNYVQSGGASIVLEQGNPTLLSLRYALPENPNTWYDVADGDYEFIPNGDDTFTLKLAAGVLDGKKVQLAYTTQILNFDIVASNDNYHIYNEAGVTIGGRDYHTLVYWNTTPRVLRKSYEYDYATRTATWLLTVNEYRLSGLGAVTVTDTLPKQLELVGVYKDSVAEENKLQPDVDYTYNMGTGDVKFVYGDGELDGAALKLYLVTKVADWVFEENFDRLVIQNLAVIEMSSLDKRYGVTSQFDLANTILGKSGKFDADEGVISWEILINSNAVDWDLAGVVLSDPLPDGLELDVESVRLLRYAMDAQGDQGPEEEVALNLNEAVFYDRGTNLFEFTFPDNAGQGYMYLLRFDTDVMQDGRYENKITLTGFGTGEIDDKTVINVSEGDDWSGAIAGRKAKITLYKTDGKTQEPLEGAVFELRSKTGAVLETAISDENGEIAFKTWLSHLQEYELVEVEAPEGYVLMSESVAVYIRKDKDGTALLETLSYYAENDPEEPYNPGSSSSGKGGGSGTRDRYPGSSGGGVKPSAPDPDPPEQAEDPAADDTKDADNPDTGAVRRISLTAAAVTGLLSFGAALTLRGRGRKEDDE